MQVEKIELIGFKSFAEKTVFHLHPGITCIVGPNGAGKSNIVDSFRWVLGEQSAKSLRGDRMEEVIFNGSATKKPRGMAEVNLYLSFDIPDSGNGNGRNVTVVTRRLYRSGESEYLINKRTCRLKDIRDLFLDSGLEVKSYSILEQGRIGDILNSKPQERRFLIEEVAGVMKYKVRKAEALSKLEQSRQNLQRVNDIILEVKRQINSLDRQVKKAERFKRLSTEIKDLEIKIAKRDYDGIKDSLDNTLMSLKSLKEEEALLRSELNRVENEIETKKVGLIDKEKVLERAITELREVEREMAELERSVAVSRTEINNLNEYLSKLTLQEIEVNTKISDSEKRIEELGSMEVSLISEIDSLKESLREKTDILKEAEANISEKERIIEIKRKEIFRLAEEISHIRNDIARSMTMIGTLEKRDTSISRDGETTSKNLADLERKIEKTERVLSLKDNELPALKERREALSSEIQRDSEVLETLRTEVARMREDLASSISRLQSLREIIHEEIPSETYEGYLPIISTVADIIDVEESYEKAIENVLSEKIKAFIVRSSEDIFKALSNLKGIKRTSFIPLDLPDSDSLPLPENEAIIGRAIDFVRIQDEDKSFTPLIKRLLDNILIIRGFPEISSLIGSGGFTFVTPDGEVVEPSGTVTVGEGRGILKRKREIRELENRIKVTRESMEASERELNRIETERTNKRGLLKEIDSSIVETEKEISLLRLTLKTQEEERERIRRKLSHLELESEEVQREIKSLKEIISGKEGELNTLKVKKDEAEAGLADIQDEISRVRVNLEEERSSITDLRLSLNSCREKLDSIQKERARFKESINDLMTRMEGFKEERSGVSTRIAQCSLVIKEGEERLKTLAIRADQMKRNIDELREGLKRESDEINASEQKARSLRSKVEGLVASINETELTATELRLRLENLEGSIKMHYGIDISSVVTGTVEEGDEERLNELRAKIQELGPVNPGILEEFEDLKNRYSFLTGQQEDLNKSIAELEEAITRINSTTRKKLREAFEQLNLKFTEVFVELFGSGKAGLVLTDENNILESGIEIMVQPPGKRVQNINLLSGGEKALTAIALLFAGFLIKPSPLCILDEVDAALDDSNIERFSALLKRLSSRIQFIVITHNRVTMEVGDYLYGITMEEPGVSKVISMQLTEVQNV